MYQQLVHPNLSQTGTVGGCLAYARSMFGAPGGIEWAWQAWQNTQYKHYDRNFPTDAAVLMWYSYRDTEGHVTVNVPGQGIYSSPYQSGTSHAVLGSIADVERIYGVVYVGWSEDINGVRVAEPIPDAPQYTVTPITPKQVQVNPGMHEWNLSLATFDDVDNNPFTTAGDSQIITAVATLVRPDFPQYTYYLENASSPIGWNTLDCTDYTPYIPPVVSRPYVAPAAPTVVNPALKYQTLVQLRWYLSSTDAQTKRNPQGAIPAGSYYQFDSGDSTVQLGNDNMHALYWINKKDNVEPIPVKVLKPSQVTIGTDMDTSWRSTYHSFHVDRTSDPYTLLQDVTMKEYTGKKEPVQLSKGNPINLVGTFVKDGIAFYRARDFKNDEYFEWFYGISMYNDDGQANVAKVTEDIAQTAERKLRDYYTYWKNDFKEIFDIMFKKGKV